MKPDQRTALEAYDGLYRSYSNKPDYLTALHVTREALVLNLDRRVTQQWKFHEGVAYFYLENYPKAAAAWDESAAGDDLTLRERSLMLVGLAFAHQFEWAAAAKQFASVPTDGQYHAYAQNCARAAREGTRLDRKNPVLSGILSIMPGGGYLYCGYPRTAISSLVVNGLFAWGTVRAFEADNAPLGVLMGILSLSWYSGNIYGGVTTASRHNLEVQKKHLLEFDVGFSF